MSYTIPKPDAPKLSPVVWVLIAVLVCGLFALAIAAYTAFAEVVEPLQAFFSAVLIEVGAVAAVVALVKGKNWIALLEIGASVTVSATYNYIQVQQAGIVEGITDGWQLLTLAVGPLIALVFLSMTVGKEFAAHDKRKEEHAALVAAWQADRQEYLDKERQRQERRNDRKEKNNQRKLTGNLPETYRNGTAPKYSDWRTVPQAERVVMASMSPIEIAKKYHVAPRTARNWANAAKEAKE